VNRQCAGPLRAVPVDRETLTEGQLEELYRRHGRVIYRYVLGCTFADTHLAEDIVQETFLRAWRTPKVINESDESCRGWLFVVARNIVIDRLRARACRPPETCADALLQIPGHHCEIERVVTSLTLQKALAVLPPWRREVLVQLYLQDRSLKQVAESLGVPIGTVKSRAHAALRALRAELTEMGSQPHAA
jgi:RNA polymerase sigma-70 factor (ECF subfamily)